MRSTWPYYYSGTRVLMIGPEQLAAGGPSTYPSVHHAAALAAYLASMHGMDNADTWGSAAGTYQS